MLGLLLLSSSKTEYNYIFYSNKENINKLIFNFPILLKKIFTIFVYYVVASKNFKFF